MTTFSQVLDAYGSLLGTLPGLNARKWVPEGADPPVVFVNPVPVTDYRDSADDDTLYEVDTLLVVPGAFDEQQLLLVPFLERTGAKSIFAAVEANRSLGFDDVDIHIRGARPLTQPEISGYRAYGAALPTVIAITGG